MVKDNIYIYKVPSFEELINKVNYVSMDHNNIHALAVEVYKNPNDMSPEIRSEVSNVKDTFYYNLWHTLQIFTDSVPSVFNGTE